MELAWVDKSQKSGRQAIPVVLAVMVGFCGIWLPLTEAMYVPAYIAAIVFAVATPLALLVAAPRELFRKNMAFRWLSIACVFSTACAVVSSGILMSFGTPLGAVADIGGTGMWLLSLIALVTVTSCAVKIVACGVCSSANNFAWHSATGTAGTSGKKQLDTQRCPPVSELF